MGSGKSYEQYSYERALAESKRPGSMSYGEIPRKPGQDWNQWMAEQDAFNKTYTGFGIPTARAAATQRDRGTGGTPATTPRTGGLSGGGGGGGGSMMPQQAQTPAPTEYYLGPAPTLQELQLDYGEMGRRVMEVNKPFEQQFRQFNPMAEAGIRALSQAGATAATGRIGRDEISEASRAGSVIGFATGLGGRSGAGRARTARDLGLSVREAQMQGANLLAQAGQLTAQAMGAMTPVSPNEIFSTAANQASINQQIGNQNLLNAWQSKPLPGQFDISKGQYVGYQPGTYSSTKPLTPDEQAKKDAQTEFARKALEAGKRAGYNGYHPRYVGPRLPGY